MSTPIFPWQQMNWRQLHALRDRLPHALLLHGPAGTGKRVFAEHLAQSLLCETPLAEGHACGQCVSCNWFVQYSHPDYRRVRPETMDDDEGGADDEGKSEGKKTAKASKEIVIAQVRALNDFMNISTHRRGRRVIVLYPAESLNVPAANALLKSLEEPAAATVFILVSHQRDKLLPTILSRCQQFAFGMPEAADALAWMEQKAVRDAAQWLALQGGAPLAALELAQSDARNELNELLQQLARPAPDTLLRLAEKLQKSDMPILVSWLQRWLYDLFSCKQTGRIRYYPQYQTDLQSLSKRVESFALMEAIRSMDERQAIATHPLSAKLFLESMLLEYCSLFQ